MTEPLSRRSQRRDERSGHAEVSKWQKKTFTARLPLILAGVVVLALVALVVIQFAQLQQLRDPNRALAEQSAEANELVAEVSRLFMIPEEEPTIATVENAEAIREQAFFAKAEDGDKVLIFPEAELALVYRPSAQIIVNAGPLVLNAADLASQAAAEETEAETEAAE